MGNLLSTNTKSQAELDAEYAAKRKALMIEEEELSKQSIVAEREKEQVLASQFERQKNISNTRVTEIVYTIKKAKELKDMRKALNIRVAVLLCAIYYNYPFGRLNSKVMDEAMTKDESSADTAWQLNSDTILKETLDKDVFYVLCKIQTLLPLLWPTGDTEVEKKFHNYKADTTNYDLDVNANINEYLTTSLKKYLANVFESNCIRNETIDSDYQDTLFDACKKFIASVEGVKDDEDLVKRCLAFIKNDDNMNWKCFCARAGKNTCSIAVKLVPSTYPKRCARYELYEALLMLTNTCISRYGVCQTKDGFDVKSIRIDNGEVNMELPFASLTQTEKALFPGKKDDDICVVKRKQYRLEAKRSATDTEGGRCFDLHSNWVANAYKVAITNQMWDGKTYINVEDIIVNDDLITGKADPKDWMTDTLLCNDLETYFNKMSDAAAMVNGYVRYRNPTKRFTFEFLNDIEYVSLSFRTPTLNAGINPTFKTNFLFNAYNILTTKAENIKYDLYRTVNKKLMTSIDYLTLTPPEMTELQVDSDVSPLARYIYTILIQYSCKWDLTIPINDAVSMSQINSTINDAKLLPQYIWTRNKYHNYTTQGKATLSSISAPKQQLTNDTFTDDNICVVGPYKQEYIDQGDLTKF